MAIAAVIGLVSTVFQVVRAFGPPEAAPPGQKAERLFAELDAFGRGEIGPLELERAFERIGTQARRPAGCSLSSMRTETA